MRFLSFVTKNITNVECIPKCYFIRLRNTQYLGSEVRELEQAAEGACAL